MLAGRSSVCPGDGQGGWRVQQSTTAAAAGAAGLGAALGAAQAARGHRRPARRLGARTPALTLMTLTRTAGHGDRQALSTTDSQPRGAAAPPPTDRALHWISHKHTHTHGTMNAGDGAPLAQHCFLLLHTHTTVTVELSRRRGRSAARCCRAAQRRGEVGRTCCVRCERWGGRAQTDWRLAAGCWRRGAARTAGRLAARPRPAAGAWVVGVGGGG